MFKAASFEHKYRIKINHILLPFNEQIHPVCDLGQ